MFASKTRSLLLKVEGKKILSNFPVWLKKKKKEKITAFEIVEDFSEEDFKAALE